MQADFLIYDVGSTYTKISVFGRVEEDIILLGRNQVPTTVEDILGGISSAGKILRAEGIDFSKDCITLATSSAAGGLRMVAMGYMPRVTAKAAKEVSMSAGARVLEIVTHEDPPDYRVEILKEIRPDIILLAGGTDGGDRDSLLENARLIAAARVEAVVILAGNVEAQQEAEQLLTAAGIGVKRVANVMPTIHELSVAGAREAIHEEFIQQISFAKGLSKLADVVSDGVVLPTPGAILMAAELLAAGTFQEEGIGDLVIVDIGGATTDIHSILPSLEHLSAEERGLVVTNEKQPAYRTVEGNLGMRISACGIVETVGEAGVLAKLENDTTAQAEQLVAYTAYLEKNPAHIASAGQEKSFDRALAISAIEVALKRHAGHLATEYNPVMGISPGTPIGRDLRGVTTIIGVGGIFCHTSDKDCRDIIAKAMENRGISLLPENYQLYIDDRYLLYGIGAMARKWPDMALRFARTYLGMAS